eukprot:COSAG01_NODE_3804_length_5680_cov_18.223257_6_plen_379_part_00
MARPLAAGAAVRLLPEAECRAACEAAGLKWNQARAVRCESGRVAEVEDLLPEERCRLLWQDVEPQSGRVDIVRLLMPCAAVRVAGEDETGGAGTEVDTGSDALVQAPQSIASGEPPQLEPEPEPTLGSNGDTGGGSGTPRPPQREIVSAGRIEFDADGVPIGFQERRWRRDGSTISPLTPLQQPPPPPPPSSSSPAAGTSAASEAHGEDRIIREEDTVASLVGSLDTFEKHRPRDWMGFIVQPSAEAARAHAAEEAYRARTAGLREAVGRRWAGWASGLGGARGGGARGRMPPPVVAGRADGGARGGVAAEGGDDDDDDDDGQLALSQLVLGGGHQIQVDQRLGEWLARAKNGSEYCEAPTGSWQRRWDASPDTEPAG